MGSREVVAHVTMSARRTAARGSSARWTGMPSRRRMRSTNERARAGSRPTTVTSWMGRSAARHVSWKPAWTPAPKQTTRPASRRARKRAASAEVAPVLGAANHALDARLQHHLAPLVEHAVGVRHDAAIRLLGLALVHHLDLDPDRVALEDRSDHADLAAQPGHARPVDESGLHDQALGQREGQRSRRGPPAEDGFLLNELHVHEERLGEATLVHEVDDVGLGHRAAQRVIPRPDGVLLERQSASQHVAPPRYGVRAYSPR